MIYKEPPCIRHIKIYIANLVNMIIILLDIFCCWHG